ncbi:MAG: cob(I)yrinic acid a,c-diamide adenosyltransferase [Negativicutes bacterium]
MRRLAARGLIIVHTGNGKGKTTAALGLAVRAWGDGLRVLILQFIKGSWKYGELETLRILGEMNGRLEVRRGGRGFSQRDTEDKAEHRKAAQKAWREALEEITASRWDLIVLDEINYAVKFGLVEIEQVMELLDKKPSELHLVLTGRDARPELIERADLVTEMRLIKHPYQKGIKAQKGIEF